VLTQDIGDITREAGQPDLERLRRMERRFVVTLVAGFGVVLTLMVTSGAMGLGAMGRIDKESSLVSSRYQRDTLLIDRLMQQQSGLAVLGFSAAGAAADPASIATQVAQRREGILALTEEAFREQLDAAESSAWKAVAETAAALKPEDLALKGGRGADLAKQFEKLTAATNRLMDVAYDEAAQTRTAQLALDAGELQSARRLFLLALGLAGCCALASGGLAIVSFHSLKGHAATLAALSMHTLAEHEENARRFSKEMHDEFGQTLNAIESSLTVVHPADQSSGERLKDSIALLKDAQSTARELSQLLRPRILDDFGLDAGLRELARGFSQRSGIAVEYHSQLRERLDPIVETHLFRIAQEALTNTARHSVASTVTVRLEKTGDQLLLDIKDDGQGFEGGDGKGAGLGFLGMRERARGIGGNIAILSPPGEGVGIQVRVPIPHKAPQG